MIVKAISRLIGCAGMARTLQKHRYNKLAYNQFNRPFDEWSADLKRRLRPATEYLLLALSGQSNHARVCPLLDQSRQSWILARDGLSASLIGRSGSSAFKPSITTFQTIHHCSVDVAHGLVLLFGIGTRGPSTMGFENEAEQSNGRPYRQIDDRSKRTNELTSSIVPRGTSFHRSVELGFSPIACDPVRFSCCCRGLFPGPAELGAVNPYAVHDHGQSAC